MRFLKLLEKAWLIAIAGAIGLGLYNMIMLRAITHQVYFPFFCAGFCFLLYRNIKRQRQFLEERQNE